MPVRTWFNVPVTREDIESGVVRSCNSCPIALAIARAFSTPASLFNFDIAHGFVSVWKGSWFCFPKHHDKLLVYEFISKFDDGLSVFPTIFTLYLDDMPESMLSVLKSKNLLTGEPT